MKLWQTLLMILATLAIGTSMVLIGVDSYYKQKAAQQNPQVCKCNCK